MDAHPLHLASRTFPRARATHVSLALMMIVALAALAARTALVSHARSAEPTALARCFEAVVEMDEGYGVSGREMRLVCKRSV